MKKPSTLELAAAADPTLHFLGELATQGQASALDEILEKVLTFAISLVSSDSCFVYVREGEELVLRASKNPHQEIVGRLSLRIGEGITGWVAENRETIALTRNAWSDPRFKRFSDLDEDRFESFLSVPILSRGRAVGVINLQNRKAYEYTAREIASISTIGAFVGAEIEMARLEIETAQGLAEQRKAEDRFYKAFNANPEPIAMATIPGERYLDVNDSFLSVTGYERDEVIGRTAAEIGFWTVPEERARMMETLSEQRRIRDLESTFRTKRGETRSGMESAEIIDVNGEACMLAILEDVTELKQAQEKLLHDAFHDSLTSLPNRALFLDRLERTVARAKRHKDYKFAVLFIDLDRFKVVNDSLGHEAGDQLIVQVATRILQSLRLEDVISRPVPAPVGQEFVTKDDTLARLGGDEFTVLLDDLRSPTDSIRVASRIQKAFEKPFNIAGQEIYTTASVGIAASSQVYESAADVLRDADIAMYRAKAQGKARCEVFDQEANDRAIGRLKLETDLRRALERDEFCVYYQPIVSLADGNITGFEALLRWDRPGVGIVPPAEFIGVAEEMGLIVYVGSWVLRRACEQARKWSQADLSAQPLTMSVNVSGRQFKQADFVEQVDKILRETQVDPGTVKLEITETVTMDNAERTISVLKALKNLGVQLSIDDFGTGYSSLSYLRRFPMDTLKIDRSFIQNLPTNRENLEIVKTILSLARNLGMSVVAEGAETAEEIEHLKALDCDFGQGYFFSRPVDSETADRLVRKRHQNGGQSHLIS
jgi:PAS domain S-box-containing protein